ncbi:hypothetical protein BTA51_10960 [Hahella sp. CCB-MM4]|nr:hypothetical protein BTA51_10960 [Hahella sp. CCB-MM4]
MRFKLPKKRLNRKKRNLSMRARICHRSDSNSANFSFMRSKFIHKEQVHNIRNKFRYQPQVELTSKGIKV